MTRASASCPRVRSQGGESISKQSVEGFQKGDRSHAYSRSTRGGRRRRYPDRRRGQNGPRSRPGGEVMARRVLTSGITRLLRRSARSCSARHISETYEPGVNRARVTSQQSIAFSISRLEIQPFVDADIFRQDFGSDLHRRFLGVRDLADPVLLPVVRKFICRRIRAVPCRQPTAHGVELSKPCCKPWDLGTSLRFPGGRKRSAGSAP